MSEPQNIDDILRQWPFESDTVSVRVCQGDDGRELLQMRVDMGILQMETEGRPDGSYPEGEPTYLDYLLAQQEVDLHHFSLNEEQHAEIDREFVQFYHRRICWLALREYQRAVEDAKHTLALMDFCQAYSSDEQWVMSHEQFRPFVLFHRTQAAALAALEERLDARAAVDQINQGLATLRHVFYQHEAEEHYEDDELVSRLIEFRDTLRQQYDVGQTLQERLAEAVANEQYELAARLRDELERETLDD